MNKIYRVFYFFKIFIKALGLYKLSIKLLKKKKIIFQSQKRISNIRIKTCGHLIEFTSNIELSEDERNNPLVQQLLELGTKSVMTCIHSERK